RTLRVLRAPAAMEVRFLWPPTLTFSQTDRYDPEPERIRHSDIQNTWHLTASTTEPSATMQFVTVLMPHRIGSETFLPKTELDRAQDSMTVKLAFDNGAEDTVRFQPGHSQVVVRRAKPHRTVGADR
ncbi:MAG: hypothetical protein N3I86_15400, partial [Verrucomicrobiae bacterium]|nr:hypothetical protein [Verrucomicrobiae bacterium]